MSIEALDGAVPILPTPLNEDFGVDEGGLRHLIRHCIESGLDGAVVLGSNGEFPYLTFEEKRRVMSAAADEAAGRIPVVGTASAFGTSEAVALACSAREVGCQAVMAAIPAYFGIELPSILRHLKAIAAESRLPVFYYHYPEVTGVDLPSSAFEAIARIDGVVGAKVTVMNRYFIQRVIERTRPWDFRVFAGTSLLLAHCVELGGAGAFCPVPLLAAEAVKEIVTASRRDHARASRIESRLLAFTPILTGSPASPDALARGFEVVAGAQRYELGPRARPTVALLKEALRLRKHSIANAVRPPCPPIDAEQRQLVRHALDEFDAQPVELPLQESSLS
jgi:dihydrodipicolinate synthase/N-acetylneuraminate lyase